jgi:hypothetical protein
MTLAFPHLFQLNADLLFRAIVPHIDESMLQEIAQADYSMDEVLHYEQLRRMRDEGFIPNGSAWIPKEVLNLVRWSEPDQPGWKPGGTDVRGHWMRLSAVVRFSAWQARRITTTISALMKQLCQF